MGLHPAVAAVRSGVRRVLAAEVGDPSSGAAGGDGPGGRGLRVVVACSGGADSLALLAATVFEARRLTRSTGRPVHVIGATVDHGLQEGSEAVAARVVEQMAEVGADETVSARVEVSAEGIGPEAAAREARYAVLGEIAQRFAADLVLLGHTRDDQAETVLLGLARGSGGRSLAGMRRAYDRFRRPLLDVARVDTETACQVEGIAWWDDPHNADPAYARVRVRTRVLPVLEDELGPGVAATLARTADQLRIDMDHLDDLADAAWAALPRPGGESGLVPGAEANPHSPPPVVEMPVADLAALPTAVRRRVLRRAILAAGSPPAEVTYDHVLAVDALLVDWRGQRWIDLPGHLRARREDGRLRIAPAPGD